MRWAGPTDVADPEDPALHRQPGCTTVALLPDGSYGAARSESTSQSIATNLCFERGVDVDMRATRLTTGGPSSLHDKEQRWQIVP